MEGSPTNIGERQRKLSAWATQDKDLRFYDLYGLLCNREWLLAAYNHIRKNTGSRTAGIDGITAHDFEEALEGNLERLREELKAQTFSPDPVRRVYIPKGKDKWRPLGIPVLQDRIVQEALRMILEPIWEADFLDCSYGFRPGRSTKDVMSKLHWTMIGVGYVYQWIVEGDITSYFDTIPHQKLMKCVKKRVDDRNIQELLWRFLRAGVLERDIYKETLTGTPQGGIMSPLLANIYLHELDQYMERYTAIAPAERARRRRHGLPNFIYVRYADDWVVLCSGTKEHALELQEELRNFLKDDLGLALSLEKTRITHITDGLKFLGFWMESSMSGKGKLVPKITIPAEAIEKVRDKIAAALVNQSDSVGAKIHALNAIIRGWAQYYQHTASPQRVFAMLGHEIWWQVAHWLGGKYQRSIPLVIKRFGQKESFGTKRTHLILPTAFKTKRYKRKKPGNPYLTETGHVARDDLCDFEKAWLGNARATRKGWWDMRDLVLERDEHVCTQCGRSLQVYEIEVDHIKPRSGYKHPAGAEHPENYGILCTDCHRVKTKRERQAESRVR